LAILNQQAEEIKEQYARLKSHLEEEQKRMLNQAKAEAKNLIVQANQKIEQTIREIKEKSAGKEATQEARLDLQKFTEKALKIAPEKIQKVPEQAKSLKGPIEVGHWVAIENGQAEPTVGQVLEFKGKDAVVALGAIRTTVKMNRLQRVLAPKKKNQARWRCKGLI